MSVFIANFQSAKDINEFYYFYSTNGKDNLDNLLEDATKYHETIWTVPKNSKQGDIIVFCCAKTSYQHMGHVLAQTKKTNNNILIALAQKQREKYQIYAGKLLAIGKIGETPQPDINYGENAFSTKITHLELIKPIDISEFDGEISVSKFSAHTKLNDEQWMMLQQHIVY